MLIRTLLCFFQKIISKVFYHLFCHLWSEYIHTSRRICITDKIHPILFCFFYVSQYLSTNFLKYRFHEFRFFTHSFKNMFDIDQYIENGNRPRNFKHYMFSLFMKDLARFEDFLHSSFCKINFFDIP